MTERLVYENIFELRSPNKAEARDFERRVDRMLDIRDTVESMGINENKVSNILRIPTSCVNDLLNGKFRKFTVDELDHFLEVCEHERHAMRGI